jgi:hypothetical protein
MQPASDTTIHEKYYRPVKLLLVLFSSKSWFLGRIFFFSRFLCVLKWGLGSDFCWSLHLYWGWFELALSHSPPSLPFLTTLLTQSNNRHGLKLRKGKRKHAIATSDRGGGKQLFEPNIDKSIQLFTKGISYSHIWTNNMVEGMKCLPPLKRWNHGFESHSRHGCLVCVYSVCVGLCRWQPYNGLILIQGVLPTVYKIKKLKEVARAQTGL